MTGVPSPRSAEVRQSVILAAGNGVRMGSDPRIPKPLVEVCGRPLLAHAVAQAEAVGCDEAVIVVGFGAAAIRGFLEGFETRLRIRVVENAAYHDPNGTSLEAAEGAAARRFFVQMADHVFDAAALSYLRDVDDSAACRVLVDREPDPANLNDATTVRLHGHRVRSIGKNVTPFDAVDAGCFLLDHRVFDALSEARRVEPPTVSAAMRRLADSGELIAVGLGGTSWVDVDTPHELALAERCLGAAPATGGDAGAHGAAG